MMIRPVMPENIGGISIILRGEFGVFVVGAERMILILWSLHQLVLGSWLHAQPVSNTTNMA